VRAARLCVGYITIGPARRLEWAHFHLILGEVGMPPPLADAERLLRDYLLPPPPGAAAAACCLAALLTEIYLCDVRSGQEMLRRNGQCGQAAWAARAAAAVWWRWRRVRRRAMPRWGQRMATITTAAGRGGGWPAWHR
jgi:hypothetical protein